MLLPHVLHLFFQFDSEPLTNARLQIGDQRAQVARRFRTPAL